MSLYKQQAEQGLNQIKSAIIDLMKNYPEGVTNSVIADSLGLRSDYEGQNKGYLSWSILGLLVNDGVIRYEKNGSGKGRSYFLV